MLKIQVVPPSPHSPFTSSSELRLWIQVENLASCQVIKASKSEVGKSMGKGRSKGKLLFPRDNELE